MKPHIFQQYIEDLLYTHDCVIVPSFGGFLTHYEPAQIQFASGQIAPPRRRLAFNPRLIESDGLLVNYIAMKQGLPYKIAAEKLAQWVEDVGRELVTRQYVQLPRIGKIFLNADGKIEFAHDGSVNFLRAACGLPVLQRVFPISRPLPEGDAIAPVVNTNATRAMGKRKEAPALVVPSDKVAQQRTRRAAALSGLLLLLIGLPLAIWWLYPRLESNSQQASTLPLTTTTTTTTDNPPAPTPTPAPAVDSPAVVEPTPTPSGDDKKWLKEEVEVVKKVDKNAKTFVIVIGAFADPVNARRVLRRLEKEGYFPDLATTSKGLQRVGIQITCAESELKLHLQDIRRKFNAQAWVIRD